MPSTEPSRGTLARWQCVVALVALVAALAALPIRATYGAQTTADEPQYLLTALSLAEDADLDIADELDDERWREFHEAQLPEQTRPLADGRRVSPHDPLLPLYLAPAMGIGGWVAAKAALALLAGVLAALTLWAAVRRFGVSLPIATAITGIFAASAPLAAYGTQVYPEVPAAVCTLLAVIAVTGPFRRRDCWVLVAAVIALPWLAIKYAPVAAILAGLGLLRLHREGRRPEAIAVSAALVGAAGVFVGLHLAVWDGMTAYASGDHFVGGEFTAIGSVPNYAGRARRLIGLLIDREFGLAAWQPAWLVAVPAVALLARRPPPHWPTLWLPLTAGWLTATFVALTMHGYWFPGRQVVVVLPLAAIAIAVAADRSRWLRVAVVVAGVLGIYSFAALTFAGLNQQITFVVDFYEVADPWYRTWSALLPAYRFVTPAMWLRHGLWLVAAATTVLLAFRLGHRGGAARGR